MILFSPVVISLTTYISILLNRFIGNKLFLFAPFHKKLLIVRYIMKDCLCYFLEIIKRNPLYLFLSSPQYLFTWRSSYMWTPIGFSLLGFLARSKIDLCTSFYWCFVSAMNSVYGMFESVFPTSFHSFRSTLVTKKSCLFHRFIVILPELIICQRVIISHHIGKNHPPIVNVMFDINYVIASILFMLPP